VIKTFIVDFVQIY